MPPELHIASILVHARPERLPRVLDQLEGMGCEVHLTNAAGKIVATHEAASTGDLGDALTRMQRLDDVLAATMVFHHCEPAEQAEASLAPTEQAREVSP